VTSAARSAVILLADTQSYRVEDFVAAARRLDVEAIVGSNRCHVLAELFDERFLVLDFERADEAARTIVEFVRGTIDARGPADAAAAARVGSAPIAAPLAARVRAIVPAGDRMAVVAAMASEALGLPHNPVAATLAAGNKRLLREALARAGIRAPAHQIVSIDDAPEAAALAVDRTAGGVGFPCVLKPLRLSASRGVMRADDADSFARAFRRVAALLCLPEIRIARDPENERILVEEFVPGREVALEGMLTRGSLRVLALFDKPDPLDGPFFEETIYVTPSRLPERAQRGIVEATETAARAIGLTTGPVHAELRVNERGAWVIEVAARSIGGLCSRALRFGVAAAIGATAAAGAGTASAATLEELILRHALGEDVAALARESRASGVMMIPIPRAGILREVRGADAAAATPGIVEVAITAKPGETLLPLPEGASYLGFLFARGDDPIAVEAALRAAHGALAFTIAPLVSLRPTAEPAG